MEQRSIFVTVVAWIFIVFSGIGVLELAMFSFVPFGKMFPPGTLPAAPGQPDPTAAFSMMRGFFLFMLAVTLWVLLSSIGLLLRKNWARISYIVMMILGVGFSGLYVLIGVFGAFAFRAMPPDPKMPVNIQAMMPVVMGVMAVMGLLFAGLYGWILYKLLSDRIRQEFQAAKGA